MPNESKETTEVENFSPEEAKEIAIEMDEVLAKHNGLFYVSPTISQDGRLGAKLEVFKKSSKVKDAEVSEPIPSPFVETDAGIQETD